MKAFAIERFSVGGKYLGYHLYAEKEWNEYPAIHSERHIEGHFLTNQELEAVAREAFISGFTEGHKFMVTGIDEDEAWVNYWQKRTRLEALNELAADAQKNDMGYE